MTLSDIVAVPMNDARPFHGRRCRRQFYASHRALRVPDLPHCGLGIGPDDLWDLGHDDYNPAVERPEHRECNRRAANQLKTSREW
jgi:hypothetical protein